MSRLGPLRGRQAEERALDFLRRRGLRLLARNQRTPGGEIDLVMEDGETVVFVEVRLRRRRGWGDAAESVDARKRRRLVQAAAHFLARHPRLGARPARFDVVAMAATDGPCTWIRDAFRP